MKMMLSDLSFGRTKAPTSFVPDFIEESWHRKTSPLELFSMFLINQCSYDKYLISAAKEKSAAEKLASFPDIKTIIFARSESIAERVVKLLGSYEIKTTRADNVKAALKIDNAEIIVANGSVASSFFIPKIKTLFLSDSYLIPFKQLYSFRESSKTYREGKRKSIEKILQENSNFETGDLVVHKQFGLGRFLGIEKVTVNKAAHDFVKLEYQDGDKLYVPVENFNLISKYGEEGNESDALLDKLGSTAWQKRRLRAKAKIEDIAAKIIAVAAKRKTSEASSFNPASELVTKFYDAFPYQETEDQLTAIEDVEQDLKAGFPMDRLLCGDVGFGKTEVAMRASFIATCGNHGKVQVAVISPTTLLSWQHYQSFKERFAQFPDIKIAHFSRLVTEKEKNRVIDDVGKGEIDIVIGTHAILNKKLKFHNLGFLVIDEEHNFGVKQKEALKELKANVHVLSLSATPIPRTLQMSLFGIKDLSILATPPASRLPVKTFLVQYDALLIREAVMREYYRGGRVFFLCPRIEDLGREENRLKGLLPEIKIKTAHGKLSGHELSEIMTEFTEGKFDLLLCTSIISYGIDISAANTIIINRAEMFGLAQLYQIRGRVGRRDKQAYAYLMVDNFKRLKENALRRLEVIRDLSAVSSGFTIASMDSDMRGAGNILGEEQSGNIRDVGYELYQEMLLEAIANMKSQAYAALSGDESAADVGISAEIKADVSVSIPDKYIEDDHIRLQFYRRISLAKKYEELQEIRDELLDRFGALPVEVVNLFNVAEIKIFCEAHHITKLDCKDSGLTIEFSEWFKKTYGESIMKYAFSGEVNNIKILPSEKIKITIALEDGLSADNVKQLLLGFIGKVAVCVISGTGPDPVQ